MDLSLFHSINGLAGHGGLLDGFMVGCANYLPVVFAAALLTMWLTQKERQQRGALLASVSTLIALGLAQLIGLAYPRPRPYDSLHGVHLLIARTQDTSFPSDHATLGFAIAVLVLQFNPKLGLALLPVALLLCFARVYVGAHYPTDVIAGAALGAILSVCVRWLGDLPTLRHITDRLLWQLSRWHLA